MNGYTSTRGRVAALSRSRRPDDPELRAARDAFQFERAARVIRDTVATLPPLTGDQYAALVALIPAGDAA